MKNSRVLPETLCIGYATSCHELVAQAVRNGVNVVIWSFMEIHTTPTSTQQSAANVHDDATIEVKTNSLDLDCIRQMISDLDEEGYQDTVHLVSFGGWNGPHLDPNLLELENEEEAARKWYNIWKTTVGDVFHGIDWDLEGHDDLKSPTNTFSTACLEAMGRISRLAKQDGYIIGMAPPQSYLDIHSPKFSRHVNLQEEDRPWHHEFHYFGANVYSYLLAKYGNSIDFVSVQFYESYSKAAMNIHHHKISPSVYLESYVDDLVDMQERFPVRFSDDPAVNYETRDVPFPLPKLVLGFANGWALDTGDKALFVEPHHVKLAYDNLVKKSRPPRGFMFWVIGEEGSHGIQYASALNAILKTRTSSTIQKSASGSNDEL